MYQRSSFSFSSNFDLKQHHLQAKKSNRELQIINRFRKIHLYNAIHSASKPKITHSLKPFINKITVKDILLSATKSKKSLMMGISLQKENLQNRLLKLRPQNLQKRPQTINKLPIDRKSIRISVDKKSPNRRQLTIRPQPLVQNRLQNQKQRLSLRLSGNNQNREKIELCSNSLSKCNSRNFQRVCILESQFSDKLLRRTSESSSLRSCEKYQERINNSNEMGGQKFEINEQQHDKQEDNQIITRPSENQFQEQSTKQQSVQIRMSQRKNYNEQNNPQKNNTNNELININQEKKSIFTSHSNLFAQSKSIVNLDTNKNLKQQKQKVQLEKLKVSFWVKSGKQNNSGQSKNILYNSDNLKENVSKRAMINKRKPAYIGNFLKETEIKDKKDCRQTKTVCGGYLVSEGNPDQCHWDNYSHTNSNMIEILHPQGEFSTYFKEQFNPW